MAKRMALIPSDFISRYHLQKPEFVLEDEIESLLNKSTLPDEMKAKLLSELINKYHRAVHGPSKPILPSVASEDTDNSSHDTKNLNYLSDPIYNQILVSVAPSYKKYLPELISALRRIKYKWNKDGELVIDDEPVKFTHVADLFSYISKNRKGDLEPFGFPQFFEGIIKANIPSQFIIRKSLKEELLVTDKYKRTDINKRTLNDSYFQESKLITSDSLGKSQSQSKTTAKKWLTF